MGCCRAPFTLEDVIPQGKPLRSGLGLTLPNPQKELLVINRTITHRRPMTQLNEL